MVAARASSASARSRRPRTSTIAAAARTCAGVAGSVIRRLPHEQADTERRAAVRPDLLRTGLQEPQPQAFRTHGSMCEKGGLHHTRSPAHDWTRPSSSRVK